MAELRRRLSQVDMTEHGALHHLAWLSGVQTSHWDALGKHHVATPERLAAVLRVLGTLDDVSRARESLAAEIERRRGELCEPCHVAPVVELRVPADSDAAYRAELALEAGGMLALSGRLGELAVAAEEAETRMVRRTLELPADLALGYHRLRVEVDGRAAEALVIAAPPVAYGPPIDTPPTWGVFAPLYSIRSDRAGGAGDLGDLRAACGWVRSLGGSLVGTLPLLAGYYDEPFEPSPYAPATRLFWNELYADVGRIESDEAERLAGQPLVDYRAQMALKRRELARRARDAHANQSLRDRVEAFARERPRVADYARFRAVVERQRTVWTEWPSPLRDGVVTEFDYDQAHYFYHLFCQQLIHEQLSALKNDGGCAGLYLDLPVGAGLASYDVWRERTAYAEGAGVGAPPDELFAGGQDWGLPPLHPRRLREQHYRYFIECVRAHVEHAAMLRIDHVMGLHRLYWVVRGEAPTNGLYVHYNAREAYAILALESHRYRCAIAGEDLGTVPDEVRPAMARRGFYRLHVAQFSDDPPPIESVASLDTHDTMTYAAFCAARFPEADAARTMREATLRLAASPARVVLVTLEDLWGETEPQNVPGTTPFQRPNWARKMARTWTEITSSEQILSILREVELHRKNAPGLATPEGR